MQAQRGISLTGFMVFAFIAVALLLLGFKIGPAYSEFYTLQKIMKTMASEPALQTASRSEINNAYNNRATIENIKSITYQDLEVEKTDSGIVISATYSVRVPLFYNLSACMDFNPTSAK
ncbi:MAG: DUF4845 domain-containing protein [Burkholderiales bacterium]